MSWVAALALYLVRTLHLLSLALAPTWLSPEPLPPRRLLAIGAASAVALAAILVLSARFAAWVDSTLAKRAAALLWLAVATALAVALYFRGRHAPLAQGAPFVAVPLWAALATLASASAEQWLGSSFKHKRMGSAILVVGVGVLQLLGASELLGSREQMWWSALRRDGGHARAVDELTKTLLAKRKLDEVVKVADRCLKMHPPRSADAGTARVAPATCACLELRAEAKLRARDAEAAVRDAQIARDRCPDRRSARATLAEALALAGRPDRGEAEARAALEDGGDPARLRYALALAYQRSGRAVEALQEVARAIDAGAGRDAKLFAGALAIVAGDLDGAEKRLQPLVKDDPSDSEALYNLALVADKRGDYNGARQGYLAALKAEPKNADARYNLAMLTFRAGVTEESRHHARRFIESFPEDSRGKQLAQTTGTLSGAARGEPPPGGGDRDAPPAGSGITSGAR